MNWQKRGTVLIVVSLFLVLMPLVAAQCLLSPAAENVYCVEPSQAQALCDQTRGCDFEAQQVPQACEDLPECAIVDDCSVDCESHTLGYCQELGGRALTPQEEVQECSQGCCITENACVLQSNKFSCDQFGLARSTQATFDTSILSEQACAAECGEVIEAPPTQQQQGTSTLSGTVTDGTTPLSGALILARGPGQDVATTDASGNYQLTLPVGRYTITATKQGYQQQQEQLELRETTTQDFVLTSAFAQGVRGITYIDSNNNRRADPNEAQPGVTIFIDSIFKGRSTFPLGQFELPASPGTHQVSATFQGFSGQVEAVVSTGQTAPLTLLLTQLVGECSEGGDAPQKNINVFSANHVPGQAAVRLLWQRPCAEVIGYRIEKFEDEILSETFSATPTQTEFIDTTVDWAKSYTYTIRATYTSGLQSEQATESSITLGNEFCEGRYDPLAGWETLCLVDDPQTPLNEQKIVWTCSDQNQITSSGIDCAVRDGDGHVNFCAKVSDRQAECKDAGICRSTGGLFGLYYNEQMCYGTKDLAQGAPNFCYYEYTDTIVDSCLRCDSITSCFDYRSQGACELNNCIDKNCAWVASAANDVLIDYSIILPELVAPETGKGYCVEQNYKKDDQCQLCGPQATLFENYFCTAEVCSSLGSCFSNPAHLAGGPLSSCVACGTTTAPDRNCYAYTSQLECTGSLETSGITKNDRQEFTLSEDQCEWQRCRWQGETSGQGQCVKDGDGDTADDCATFSSAGEIAACRLDVSAPTTSIVGNNVYVISLARPELTIQAKDDRSPLGVFGYCFGDSDVATCTDFNEVSYPGILTDETLRVNFTDQLAGQQIDGQTFRLAYYSQDKYKNQESLQVSFVYVDIVPPRFILRTLESTVGALTTLSVFLEDHTELMTCNVEVQPLLPAAAKQTQTIPKEELTKSVEFADLNGPLHKLTVRCTDEQGNLNEQSRTLVFDTEDRITIVEPASAISSPSTGFSLRTETAAQCQLYQQTTLLGDFVTNEQGLEHQFQRIDLTALYPGPYTHITDFVATCRDAFTQEEYFEIINFALDTTPSMTQAHITEAGREHIRTGDKWEIVVKDGASVRFSCDAEVPGFECSSFHVCQGTSDETCRDDAQDTFTEFSTPLSINETTELCYFSIDAANHLPPIIQCGLITVAGNGIELINPEHFYFEGQVWGVTSEPELDLTFRTLVATSECRIGFSPTFSFEQAAGFQRLVANPATGNYIVPNFPTSVGLGEFSEGQTKTLFVRCKTDDQVSEAQPITIEYDTTPPAITTTSAVPNPVIEGTKTQFTVISDDKSVCKYGDAGQTNFNLMPYTFPTLTTLRTTHQDTYTINIVGLKQELTLTTQCRNGAGLLSDVQTLDLSIDYTVRGNIIEKSPSGFITDQSVLAHIITSKSAGCQIKLGDEFVDLQTTDAKSHTFLLENLEEKEHTYPIRCTLGSDRVEDTLVFTVDRSAPIITAIEDGNVTCGQGLLVTPQTNEASLQGFYYEVHDAGAQRRSSFSFNVSANDTARGVILNATVGPETPIDIPATDLEIGRKYLVKVAALDAAGNQGQLVTSDGVEITNASHELCTADTAPPQITVLENTTCQSTFIELRCSDATACRSLSYGIETFGSCNPSRLYTQKIPLATAANLCYSAEDNVGNKINGSKTIAVADGDGDGIRNSCDECPLTSAGKSVDSVGCSTDDGTTSQTQEDSDNDGLPDYWEQNYNTIGCALNYLSLDSDVDGIPDTSADYDEDGFSNYEEYTARTDPCVPDAPLASQETEANFTPVAKPVQEESSLLPWLLLLLGFLMVGGGIGYLVYFYKTAPQTNAPSQATPQNTSQASSSSGGIIDSWKSKLQDLRRAHASKQKERQRESIFGTFSQDSSELPHVDKMLEQRGSKMDRLQQAAQHYHETKEQMQPGLRPEEKSLFNKLSQIAQKTKDKNISEIMDKSEAHSIFDKLKALSKKRKE